MSLENTVLNIQQKMNTTDILCRNTSLTTKNFNWSLCARSDHVEEQTLDVPTYYLSSQLISTIFLVVIFLIGVFGNLIVILVVCLNRKMKTSVNIYLVNLCVADVLVLSVCMPTVLVDIYAKDVWYFGKTMCSFVPFLENTVVHASVLTLIAISVERYRVVCKPLKGIRDNFDKCIKIIPCIWLICGASNVPWFYIATFRDSIHLDGTPIKVCRLPTEPSWHKAYVSILCAFYYVIPLLTLLILYCRICHVLHVSNKYGNTSGFSESCKCHHRQRLRLQVINIIVCLVILFFVFHLPYRVISLWLTFADTYYVHKLGIHTYFNIIYSARILFYFNHAINPIIYNFVSTKFRAALRCLITNRGGSLTSSNRCRQVKFVRPKHSLVLIVNRDYNNGGIVRSIRGTSTPSSSRRKINEFYPMYEQIAHNNRNDEYQSEDLNEN